METDFFFPKCFELWVVNSQTVLECWPARGCSGGLDGYWCLFASSKSAAQGLTVELWWAPRAFSLLKYERGRGHFDRSWDQQSCQCKWYIPTSRNIHWMSIHAISSVCTGFLMGWRVMLVHQSHISPFPLLFQFLLRHESHRLNDEIGSEDQS